MVGYDVDRSGRGPGRLPNLVIAGVAKAGTTSMFHYLGQHPDIGTSDVKELRYFTPLRHGQPLAPLGSYAAHFRGCERHRYALEATPGYFYGGRVLAHALRDTCPSVRVLVMLRAPEERCWSWFGFVKSRLRIPSEMTFEAYLDRCEELYHAGVDDRIENQAFWGLGAGCYARWLDAWTATFGPRLRLVFFDHFVADPRAELSGVCGWLGLDSRPVATFDLTVDNKTTQYRSGRLQRAAIALNRGAEPFFLRHPGTKRRLRAAYYRVNRDSGEPTMPASQRARLVDFYRPHNLRLREQLATVGLGLPTSW